MFLAAPRQMNNGPSMTRIVLALIVCCTLAGIAYGAMRSPFAKHASAVFFLGLVVAIPTIITLGIYRKVRAEGWSGENLTLIGFFSAFFLLAFAVLQGAIAGSIYTLMGIHGL